MPSRYQHHVDTVNGASFTKWQCMLDARARQAVLHQACCALGNDNLPVWRDVVAMRVGNERKVLCFPWIQPDILFRQVDSALVTNFNHKKKYFRIPASSIASVEPVAHIRYALTAP